MKTSMRDLETKGFVSMTYPADLRKAVQRVIGAWQEFYSLPTDTKKALPYSNGGAGVGYELKEGVGRNADKKENFDLTLAGQKWLENNIADIDNPVALNFIRDGLSLIDIMKPLILDFARQAEKEFNLPGFADEVGASEDAFFVRFIHYFGDREAAEETASAHVDQSGFTLHLFESAPGLQCLTFDNQWIDMPVSDGETVIIPAMQLQLRSEGRLKALCHRVIANPDTARDGRCSAVCFVQLKNDPKYDKDTWGRLQEKAAGFNYPMSVVEFRKFFKN